MHRRIHGSALFGGIKLSRFRFMSARWKTVERLNRGRYGDNRRGLRSLYINETFGCLDSLHRVVKVRADFVTLNL